MKTLTKIMFYIPKKILIKFIFFLFLLLCFNVYVNAASLTTYNHHYNLEYGSGSCGSSNKYTYMIEDTVMGGYQAFSGNVGTTYDGKSVYFAFDFNYDLSANTYYDVKINAMLNDFTQNITSSSISLSNGTSCGSTTLNNISLVSLKKSATSGQYKTLTIRIFSATAVDYWSIIINNESFNNLTGVSNFGISSLSIEEVDMSNTDAILDNQNSNTNSIINNNNSNTNDIINNQNQNNEDLKDTINDNFNSCRPSYNKFNINSTSLKNYYTTPSVTNNSITLQITGTSTYTNTYSIFPLDNSLLGKTISFSADFYSQTNSAQIYLFSLNDANNIVTSFDGSYSNSSNGSLSFTYTLPSSLSGGATKLGLAFYSNLKQTVEVGDYVQYSNIMVNEGDTPLSYEKYGEEICSNKIDDTNDKLDNLNGTLTDSSSPNTESFLDDVKNVFDDGPISTLILMPFTLLNRYVDGFNGSCSSISLGNLYGTDLSLPCINLENKLGSTLWRTIDGLVSIFMIYNIGMLFVMVFNDITSLRDTFDSLYTPQHAKPLGKHTSEVE